jgi:ParB-like chromosome segregation protein Spo0J
MGYFPSAQRPLAGPSLHGGSAPIAQVTGASAAAAAFEEVSAALTSARAEGRLIQRLPLDAIDAAYLVRDRLAEAAGEDLQSLIDSLRARGQQTPIEVVALEDGRYGLISGWRRLTALQRLHRETGEDRFAQVLALLRRPAAASDAYLAMVEENEIRSGLSYYERARIVARAADLGVFADEAAALRALFAAASRAKRSKIGSFLGLYHALDARLRFPGAISERLGLALARAIAADAGFGARLADRLRKAGVETAEAEQDLLQRALTEGVGQADDAAGFAANEAANEAANDDAGAVPPDAPQDAPPASPAGGATLDRPSGGATLDRPSGAEEIAYGIWMEQGGGALRPRLTLSGPRVDAALRARLVAWLRQQG